MSPRVVSLPRDNKRGLGLAMAEWNHAPVIVGFAPDSPAARCDRLYVGDAILAVNGTLTHDRPLAEVKRLLKEAGPRVSLKVRHAKCLEHFDDANVMVTSWRGWPADSCDYHQRNDAFADGAFLFASPTLSSTSLNKDGRPSPRLRKALKLHSFSNIKQQLFSAPASD